ncbi:MAG: peptide ABC transporter substrate-binding protein [Pyrinomonadaceae bacterium]|nr:peptide ABC transporter substrate-binding protein [Pyrinomonadaceae bacterium]
MTQRKSVRSKSCRRWRPRFVVSLAVAATLVSGGCFSVDEGERFYGRVTVPRANELRWSNGGLPQIFDPALAAVSPDIDAVRAMFEGLTDYDPQSLAPVPAVASRWESSADKRVWTFHLRRDARWSNGDPVTAHDFVRSWQRTLQLGRLAPHAQLLRSIEGAPLDTAETLQARVAREEQRAGSSDESEDANEKELTKPEAKLLAQIHSEEAGQFGAEAVSPHLLRVRLRGADNNFPTLVAHPVFRPVHQASAAVNPSPENFIAESKQAPIESVQNVTPQIISNGAFQLSQVTPNSVILERVQNYWARKTVALERVRFVDAASAEAALAAYRAGEVDVVTNAAFEPLALKLLATYRDFKRATYGALTYYAFNTACAPFTDRRIREALAIAIDRDRLSADKLGGATEAAKSFLPSVIADNRSASGENVKALAYDANGARRLLAEAGYPEGRGFPRIRLLINRNDQQRTVAEAVAGMWRSVLQIETEVIVKSWDQYEAALQKGDYDVARRSLVMQTTDETTNMLIMFGAKKLIRETNKADGVEKAEATIETPFMPGDGSPKKEDSEQAALPQTLLSPSPSVLTEAQALVDLPGFPLYFASSFTLVKPYVTGFDLTCLMLLP